MLKPLPAKPAAIPKKVDTEVAERAKLSCDAKATPMPKLLRKAKPAADAAESRLKLLKELNLAADVPKADAEVAGALNLPRMRKRKRMPKLPEKRNWLTRRMPKVEEQNWLQMLPADAEAVAKPTSL
jgi:hypothetical protein